MKHRLPLPVLSGVFIALLGSFFTPLVSGHETKVPFQPGERLVFKLKWLFVPAGEAVLEVLPMEIINGEKAYHFLLTVRSNSFIDHFYKVRDRIDSYADRKMSRSLLYKKKQQEGKTKRDVLVRFDWKKNQARYANFDEDRKPVALLPGAFDPLAVFYYSRLCDLKINQPIKRPVTDGKKTVIGIGRVVKREAVTTESGKYDTFLIEPDLKHIGGVFEKSKDAKIKVWVTADRHRIPIKLKSKVAVGSFTGELISASGI